MFKAIIIDDEKWARNIIRNFGQWAKYNIEIVGEGENGIEGLALIEKNHPDIIITDMEMTNMDGVEFLKTLDHRGRGIKIIVISGYDNFEYMKQAIHSNAMEYLLKPIDSVELNEVLKRCVHELALSKTTSMLTLHDLMDEEVINELIEKTKVFRQVIKGTDKLKIISVLDDLKNKFSNNEENQEVIVRMLNDYISSALREEMMDVLKGNQEIKQLYQQLKLSVESGMNLEGYLEQVQKLVLLGFQERYVLIKGIDKPIAEIAKEYIDLYYNEDISLNDVANYLFVSKEYLSSSFKNRYGVTLGNYILKLKMNDAVLMLKESVSHKEIAQKLGYKDITYFYKVFKKYYGKTPGDYH